MDHSCFPVIDGLAAPANNGVSKRHHTVTGCAVTNNSRQQIINLALWTPDDAIAARERAEAVERRIRADARAEIRWLHEKPWRAGKRLSDLVRYYRQRHTQSVGRSRMAP